MTAQKYSGSHSPSISANGNANGILWVISGSELLAFNACTASAPPSICQNQYAPLQLLYSTIQAPNKRDAFPHVGHFVTQTVANGKLFVGTQTSLEAYGLFPVVTVTEATPRLLPSVPRCPLPSRSRSPIHTTDNPTSAPPSTSAMAAKAAYSLPPPALALVPSPPTPAATPPSAIPFRKNLAPTP